MKPTSTQGIAVMAFNRSDQNQLQALAAEINTDPRGYGFAADVAIGNDSGVAARINVWRDGTNPPATPTAAGGATTGAIIVNKGFIMPEELANAIVYTEYTGGQAGQRQYIDMLMTLPRIDLSPTSNARTALTTIFATGSQTRTNIVNVSQRFGSRAEELFGVNTNVSSDDVAKALRG